MTQIELLNLQCRSGAAESLAETTLLAKPVWTTPIASGLMQRIEPFIVLQSSPRLRYLTPGEQRVMKQALIASTRLISRG